VRIIRTSLVLLALLSSLAWAEEVLHFSVHDGKPLLRICEQLEEKFHWRISYEDPPIYWQDELQQGVAPSGTPWLVLHPVSLSVDIAIRPNPGGLSAQNALERILPTEPKRTAFKTILGAYHGNLNRDVYRVIESDDFIHIVPTAVRDENGTLRPFQPLLDTRITIPKGKYLLLTLVSQIIAQVSNKTGMRVFEGTIPMNLFTQMQMTEEANDEAARDVLERVFNKVDEQPPAQNLPPFRLTWYLGFSHNGQNYFMNIHAVGPEQGDSALANSQTSQPAVGPKPKASNEPSPYNKKGK